MPVCRAGAFHHRYLIFINKPYHIGFPHIQHRPYNRNASPIQISDRRKCMEPSLKNQRHQHGFHYIVLMMGICHFIASHLFHGIVQCPFPHFSAKGTGIGFFPVLKYNLGNIRRDNSIWYFQGFTKSTDLIQIQILKAKVNGYGMNPEVFWIEAC